MNVLGVAGSLREGSYGTMGAIVALEAATRAGAKTRLLELRTANLPMYNPDEADVPHAGVAAVQQAVDWADAFLLSSPDYHGSVSGAMKNFLDYHWKELAGKLFGYVVASHEKGLTVMDHMRTAVRQCYGWSLPYGAAVHGSHDFGADGKIKNAALQSRLEMVGRDLVIYGELLRNQFLSDRRSGQPDTFAARYAQD